MFALICEGEGKLIPILSGSGEGKQCFSPILCVPHAQQSNHNTSQQCVAQCMQGYEIAYMEHISAY